MWFGGRQEIRGENYFKKVLSKFRESGY